MFSVSTAVLIARYKALGDGQATGRTLFTAITSSVALGIFFTVLMASRPSQALRLMGASSPEMIRLGAPYLLWRATALPANMFLLVAGGAFRGIGNARENFTNGLVVGLVNLVLDPVLMFSCNLGVAGAAMATAIAQWIGALSYIFKMTRRKEAFGLNLGWKIIPGMADVQEFLTAGTAMLFRSLCNVGAWTLMASIATRMGVVEIAAHQLILSMWLVIAFVQDAVGAAGQVLVSQQLGNPGSSRHAIRRGKARARAIAKRVISFSAIIGVALSLIGQIVLPSLIPLFCSSPEVIALTSSVLPIVLLGFPVCCVVWTWDSVYYGASDFKYNAKVIAVSSSIAVSLTLASLHYEWGLLGLWSSMVFVYFGLRVVAHYRRFNSEHGPFGKSTLSLNERDDGAGQTLMSDAVPQIS
jgi:MATE family multidrug resistance protein